jgi:hypothetical protein
LFAETAGSNHFRGMSFSPTPKMSSRQRSGRGEENNNMDDDDDDDDNDDPVNQPMPLQHNMQNHTYTQHFLHLSSFEVTAIL